tara:strand:+ start:3470 stop:4453 length:984 start_codon:yes stop_codon:yes gene_type:complete
MQPKGRLAKYITNDDLKTKGYCIIKSAVDEQSVKNILDCLAQDLNNLGTNINLFDPKTHTNDRWPQTYNGLIQSHGTGHWNSAWLARKACRKTWSELYNCNENDLLSSFDGLSIVRPKTQTAFFKTVDEDGLPKWFHRDQKMMNKKACDCVQGLLSLSTVKEGEHSTILMVPHTCIQDLTNEFYDRFFDPSEHFKNDSDWHYFSKDELAFLKERCDIVKPNLNPGDMLLWLSCIPHAAAPGFSSSPRSMRIAMFNAMMPRQLVSERILKKRKRIANTGLTTTHNVTDPILFKWINGNHPVIFKPQIHKIYDENTEEEIKNLIGFNIS